MIRVYGASDDLVEIEGDISEEFGHYADDDEERFLAFSDGTVLRVHFDRDSIWRFTPLVKGRARLTHIVCLLDNDEDAYSDVVHLFDEESDEPIRWVVYGVDLARQRR